MYTYNDLVAALQSGVSVEDIAAQMTKDLNAAKAEYDRLAAEKAAAEKKAQEAAQKRACVTDVYHAISAYVTRLHPKSTVAQFIVENGQPTAEELDEFAEQLDELVTGFDAMLQLSTLFDSTPFGTLMADQNITVKPDPIEEFLNKNVRKH